MHFFRRLFGTLTHQQPFKPHSKGYLLLQKEALQQAHPTGKVTIEKLDGGTPLMGRLKNTEVVYGSVPMHPEDTQLSGLTRFTVRTTLKCGTLHQPEGVTYYIHPTFTTLAELEPAKDDRPKPL